MTLPETGAPGTARGPDPCTPAGRSPAVRAGSARGTRSGCSCKDSLASGRARAGCCHCRGSPCSPPQAETPRADTMLLGGLRRCPGRRGHQRRRSHGSQGPSQEQQHQFNQVLVLSQGPGVPHWPCTTWAAPQLPRHPSLQEGPVSHSAGAGVKSIPVGQREESLSAVLQPAFGWKWFGNSGVSPGLPATCSPLSAYKQGDPPGSECALRAGCSRDKVSVRTPDRSPFQEQKSCRKTSPLLGEILTGPRGCPAGGKAEPSRLR